MAKVFLDEETVKEIIKRLYKKSKVAGLICELCYLRNFRVGDVRHAKVMHFRMDKGYPEIYLCYDKTQTNSWYPIPINIYQKVQDHIRSEGLKPDDYVFEITMNQPGRYKGHRGVITHEWILKLWLNICKELGIYTETIKEYRDCVHCKYQVGKGKCKVKGSNNIKNRAYIHINHCIKKGKTRKTLEKHPKLHQTLRGASAKTKIKYYMDKGLDYETALMKVFVMSNWKNYKVFRSYIDGVFEKEIGDRTFVEDWLDKRLM